LTQAALTRRVDMMPFSHRVVLIIPHYRILCTALGGFGRGTSSKGIEVAKNNVPPYRPPPPTKILNQTFSLFGALSMPSEDEINRYQREREEYIKDFEEYLKYREFSKYAKESLILTLDIEIENKRNNVKGLSVDLHIPDSVRVLTEEQYYAEPEEPEEPKPIRTQQEMLASNFDLAMRLPRLTMPAGLNDTFNNVSPFEISEEHSWKVHFYVASISHHHTEPCGQLYVLFPSFEDIDKLKVPYELHADNIPSKRRKGKIKIKPVKVKSESRDAAKSH